MTADRDGGPPSSVPFERYSAISALLNCERKRADAAEAENLMLRVALFDQGGAKVIAGALKSAIEAHGPITPQWIGSAEKRIRSQLRSRLIEPTRNRGTPRSVSYDHYLGVKEGRAEAILERNAAEAEVKRLADELIRAQDVLGGVAKWLASGDWDAAWVVASHVGQALGRDVIAAEQPTQLLERVEALTAHKSDAREPAWERSE